MVCGLHQIDCTCVYVVYFEVFVAYFEVFVDWCMFTFLLKKAISWFVVILFTLWVEIVEYMCVYSLWYTGFSLCMLCCVKRICLCYGGKETFLKLSHPLLSLCSIDWGGMNLMWRICGMIVTGENKSQNLSQCHLFQHISYMDWPGTEPGPPFWVTDK